MTRLTIIFIIFLCASFVNYTDKSPRLTNLSIQPNGDVCNSPNAVIEEQYLDKKLILSFGYDDYFEKQGTIDFTYVNDTLFIKIIERNKRITFIFWGVTF